MCLFDQNLSIICRCHQCKLLRSEDFFYGTMYIDQISSNLKTNHHLENGFQVCTNEGPSLLPRGDNIELKEMVLKNICRENVMS